MHDVGAGWLITTLSPSPLMVSLVQAATTLPFFLFALPAGALADIVDRRLMLMAIQAVTAAVALALGIVVLVGEITPIGLLAFTFALGICEAFLAPTWQAIVPSLVSKAELAPAVALNSVGINISRAIGPALGGAIIVGIGIAWPFLLNAAGFVMVVLAILWWKPTPAHKSHLPAEHFWNAIRAGVRYTCSSEPLKATLARAAVFFVFASAYWALLPLIVRGRLGGGAQLYGVMVTCIGAGAVAGALLLPRIRKRFGSDRIVAIGSIGTAAVMITFALVHVPTAAAIASLIAGASWIAVLSCLNISAQISLPDWVRARGLSVYSAVFFGSMALGSVLWGQIAGWLGIPSALLLAALGAVVCIPLTRRFRLLSGGDLDLSPSSHWPPPLNIVVTEDDRGPVLITVEYQVDSDHAPEFLSALHELAKARRRDGAFAWEVFRDAARPNRYLEYFKEVSWLDHLRHHERVTSTDRIIQDRVLDFHIGAIAPIVTHFLAADASTTERVTATVENRGLK